MTPFRLLLFGAPRLERNGTPLTLRRSKALALLTYLAVRAQPQQREALLSLLWPEFDAISARNNLRRELSLLKTSLGQELLLADRQQIGLNSQAELGLDVAVWNAHLAAVQQHAHVPGELCDACAEALAAAVRLHSDDFMAGFNLPESPAFDEWQFFQREALRQQLASVLQSLIVWHRGRGAYDPALPYALRWLALDPLHEPAHRELMRLYAWVGQHAAAMRQYDECARILDRELGAEPEAETTALYQAIRTRQLGVPMAAAVLATAADVLPDPKLLGDQLIREHAAEPVPALPPQQTPFVGREQELAILERYIASPQVRLVTIVGPGGMGKTRLALESARCYVQSSKEEAARFPDGVFWVPLAALSSAESIVAALADALDIHLDVGPPQLRTPQQQVHDQVRHKTMLLVLDNFEHLLTGAEIVAELLQAAPQITVLATSRERLHLHEEHVLVIHGLAYPSDAEHTTRMEAAQYAAVQLFVQGAQRVQHDFVLTDTTAVEIARICRAVEAMPLAIELAAAWLHTLPLPEIWAELQQSFDILETTARNVPQRQRSIRAVFDTTWQRLEADEQAIFARMSVFRGGCTRNTAQHISGASLRMLRRLVSKSLLRYDAPHDRYEMHELLRQYAGERLAATAEGEAMTQQRHAVHYCAALHQRWRELRGAQQATALAAIEADLENMRRAWQWAVDHEQVALIAQAMDGLGYFYEWQGRFKEGAAAFAAALVHLQKVAQNTHDQARLIAVQKTLLVLFVWQSIFERLLGRAPSADTAIEHAFALLNNLRLATADIRQERAVTLLRTAFRPGLAQAEAFHQLEQSLALYRELDDPVGIATVLSMLANFVRQIGNYAKARELLEESLALWRSLGNQRGTLNTLASLSLLCRTEGRLDQAEHAAKECVELGRQLSNQSALIMGLHQLGSTYYLQGNIEQAYAVFMHCLALVTELGSPLYLAPTLLRLSIVTAGLGRFEEARSLTQQCLELAQQAGDPLTLGTVRGNAGMLAGAQGDWEQAQRELHESIALLRSAHQPSELPRALGMLSFVEFSLGNAQRARRYAYEALERAAQLGDYAELIAMLPSLIFCLAENGEMLQATELWGAARRIPLIIHDAVFERIREGIARHMVTLPPNIAEAALRRGQSYDIWQATQTLVGELHKRGWADVP